MPKDEPKFWRPAMVRAYETVRGPMSRKMGGGDPIEGCVVTAVVGIESRVVGPRPTPNNPGAQEIRWVPVLYLTVLRDGRDVAFATLPLEELVIGGTASDADGVADG